MLIYGHFFFTLNHNYAVGNKSRFSHLETALDISYNLSPEEALGMKCQTLLPCKGKKNILKCCLTELKIGVAKINMVHLCVSKQP